MRIRIEKIFSDNIERYRKELENTSNEEEVTSKLKEILHGYKEDVQLLKDLIEKNHRGDPIELFKTALEIRQEDVDFLDILINRRLEKGKNNNPRLYIERSKALQVWTNLKRFKIWFMQNIGPSLSIAVTVVSGLASFTIFILDKLEDGKKTIDDIRERVKRLLQEVEKEHNEQNLAIENVDQDTFKQTMSNLVGETKKVLSRFFEMFFQGSKKVITFVQKHIEIFLAILILLVLYEIHDRPSPRKIHSMVKHRLREKLTL